MPGDDGQHDDLHGWGAMLSRLEAQREAARAMGGPEKLARVRERGQLNARERIDHLLDPGSFRELGTLVGAVSEQAPADAFPAGMGTIDGRPVLVGAEDFTVRGGSIGLGAADKRYRLTQLALEERVPLVFVLHGAGHRVTNALKGHGRTPNDLQGLVELSGQVPTVCVVLGASAGHGALAAPLMDFAVMSRSAALFSAGPPLVEAAIGEKVTKEELGGPDVHVAQSGVVHNVAEDDAAALDVARRYPRLLPEQRVRAGADRDRWRHRAAPGRRDPLARSRRRPAPLQDAQGARARLRRGEPARAAARLGRCARHHARPARRARRRRGRQRSEPPGGHDRPTGRGEGRALSSRWSAASGCPSCSSPTTPA